MNIKISEKALFVLWLITMTFVGISMMENEWCETGSAIIWSITMLIGAILYVTHKLTKKKEKKDPED